MKKISFLILLFIICCSNLKNTTSKDFSKSSSQTFKVEQSNGFSSIEELFKTSVGVIKSKDKSRINDFISKIMPDSGTIQYMNNHNCKYRGVPNADSHSGGYLDSLKRANSTDLYNYCQRLERRLNLEQLRFEKIDQEINPETLEYYGCPEILFVEVFGTYSSNSDTIRVQFGELLKVNGKWKSFTDFKLW